MVGLNAIIGRQENETGQVETNSSSVETVLLAATSIPLQVVPSQSSSSQSSVAASSSSSQITTVSCPKGITYDPYPGRCRHYVDRDGYGYCDYSVPAAA